jgi:hypothetical protein
VLRKHILNTTHEKPFIHFISWGNNSQVEDISKTAQDYIYWNFLLFDIFRWFTTIGKLFKSNNCAAYIILIYLSMFCSIFKLFLSNFKCWSSMAIKIYVCNKYYFCLLINFIHICVDRWSPNITKLLSALML